MFFNALTVLSAAGAVAAAVLDARAAVAVLYPRPGTIWTPGYNHNVTWVPTPGTGSIALVNGGNTLPLASNVDLSGGRTQITVPRVNPGTGYIIQVTSDGDVSNSGAFDIGNPDVPGPQPSVSIGPSTTLVVLPSTSVVGTSAASSASSVITSAASSATSAASSIVDSASSAVSSINSSLSSVLSSATSAASSALSSVTSGASSALSSATSIRSSIASSASAAATSASPNAAVGMKAMENMKLGAALTAGVAVLATIAGASLF